VPDEPYIDPPAQSRQPPVTVPGHLILGQEAERAHPCLAGGGPGLVSFLSPDIRKSNQTIRLDHPHRHVADYRSAFSASKGDLAWAPESDSRNATDLDQ